MIGFWIIVALAALLSGADFAFALLTNDANLQIARAVRSVAITVIPYCFVRAIQKIVDGYNRETDSMKKCPDCAENVRAEARKCRFCGHQFPTPEPPPDSVPALRTCSFCGVQTADRAAWTCARCGQGLS